MTKNFYVTTPIYYPTGDPHIGSAYTTFIADTLARYHRLLGKDTFFLTGMDEHGGNIEKKAKDAKIDPQKYVDQFADVFRDTWEKLNISNDYFIQTTNPEHEKFAAELIQKSYDNGDLYEGTYEGWYCHSCEAYIAESDLVDGKCPNHPTKEPEWMSETNYYFKLSNYRDWLLNYLEENKDFVKPQKWYDYVYGLVKEGLQDIPVTRANVSWGVPVPFDPSQTIYVWYDALPNYLSVLHFEQFPGDAQDEDPVAKYWTRAVHVVGKDIIRFHAILWPAMLKSAGYELPKHVLVHGFFTANGQKIGKSNNNAVDPRELAAKYGTDPVRYALLSEFQLGNDGDFSYDRLEEKYNTVLANNWGNLLPSVIHVIASKNLRVNDFDNVTPEFKQEIDEQIALYHKHIQEFELFEAARLVEGLVSFGNKYIDEHKPWDKEVEVVEAETTLNNLSYLLSVVNTLYYPFLPESAEKAEQALADLEKIILFPRLDS